jgi:hypothetical protein
MLKIHEDRLNGKWWHRLFQVAFIVVTVLVVLPFSVVLPYIVYTVDFEADRAPQNFVVLRHLRDQLSRLPEKQQTDDNLRGSQLWEKIEKDIKHDEQRKDILKEFASSASRFGCYDQNGNFHDVYEHQIVEDNVSCSFSEQGVFSYHLSSAYYLKLVVLEILTIPVILLLWYFIVLMVYYRGAIYVIYGKND